MIFITGDTHGEKDCGKIFMAHRNRTINKGDYLIITGDFGAIWNGNGLDNKLLNKYAKLPFTILFVDGNHENFDVLYTYPQDDWCGGKVHKVRENILHLTRGQIFTIEGKTFFTMGGGTSIDKDYRLEYESEMNRKRRNRNKNKKVKVWWEQEIPTTDEINEAISNLQLHNDKVDYVITHTNSNRFMHNKLGFVKECSVLTDFLDYVYNFIEYKEWYCGHFHRDTSFKVDNSVITVVYNKVLKLG